MLIPLALLAHWRWSSGSFYIRSASRSLEICVLLLSSLLRFSSVRQRFGFPGIRVVNKSGYDYRNSQKHYEKRPRFLHKFILTQTCFLCTFCAPERSRTPITRSAPHQLQSYVLPAGIEPTSRAPQARILSVELWERTIGAGLRFVVKFYQNLNKSGTISCPVR